MKPVVLHAFSTFAVGGPQVRFAQIVNRLGDRHRHRVVSMDGRYETLDLINADVDLDVVPVEPCRSTAGNVMRFRRVLQRERPDVLLTYNWGSVEWCLAGAGGRSPIVHVADGFGPEETERRLRRRNLLRRFAFGFVDSVVVPSVTLREIARREWGVAPPRLHYVPNGIDLDRFNRPADSAFLERHGVRLRPDVPIVGTIARLRAEKNLVRLIDAFARVRARRRATLVICGDGPDRPRLERRVRQLELQGAVHFTGAVERPERVLGAFDVFALSSDTEQMPLSVLEAMAAARPVAATDVGDVRAMLSAPNRTFVTPRDDAALGEAILALLAKRDLAAHVGTANLARVRDQFAEPRMIEQYERLFAGRGTRECVASPVSSI